MLGWLGGRLPHCSQGTGEVERLDRWTERSFYGDGEPGAGAGGGGPGSRVARGVPANISTVIGAGAGQG